MMTTSFCKQILRPAHVPLTKPIPTFDLLSTTPHGHIAAVLGTMEQLPIPGLLGRSDSPERRTALALIAGRIISPGSEPAQATALQQGTYLAPDHDQLRISGRAEVVIDESTLGEIWAANPLLKAIPGHSRKSRIHP